MNKGGKPKHSYWTEGNFLQKGSNKGKLIAQCKMCNKMLQNTAIDRLKSHRKECYEVEEESSNFQSLHILDENYVDDGNNNESTGDDHNYEALLKKKTKIACKYDNYNQPHIIHEDQQLPENSRMDACKENAEPSNINKRRQTKVKSFIDNITTSKCKKIDKALLYFFIAFKLDLEKVESVHFKNFLNVIRPAYSVPNNHFMLNEILNKAYQQIITTDSLESKLVPILLVLKVEESTIISLLRNIENKYVFVDVLYTEINENEFRLELGIFIRKCIKYTYENIKINTHTVVHNLEVTMSNKINVNLDSENTESEIFIFQCHTQYIRSIQKSLICLELITKVNELLSTFKCIESKLINLGGKNIVLYYNSDLWDDYCAALESCPNNLKSMKKIVGQNFKVATNILQLIFDDSFEQEIKEVIEFSVEVESLKYKMLNLQCNIADAIEYWFQFNESHKNMQYTNILSNILKAIVSLIYLASNCLNPRYKGRIFMNNDEYACQLEEFFVDNLSAEGMGQYLKYMSQTEIFSKLFNKNVDDVMVFWTIVERKYGELAKFAQKLLQILACVSCVNMDKITQNNLTQEQQEKIKSIFYTLKLNEN